MTMRDGTWVAVGLGAMALAGTSASWSIAGSSQALYFSEDMKRPGTIGRIIMVSFLLAAILETVPVIGAIAGARDLHAVLNSSAPFEEFLRQYLPDFGMKFVSISIAIAMFNATLAGFIAIGRNLFSMGRTQLFNPALNAALTRLTRKSDAPWIALLLIGLIAALAQLLTMRVKIMLLAGNLTFTTLFYVWAVFAGRRSGRTRGADYRTPFYPLVPIVGIFIVIGELVAQWIDRDVGRPSLFVWLGVYALSYLYYRLVLVRRPQGWRMAGPEDIDAQVKGRTEFAVPG
jgi:amino acid transporter